MCLADQCVGHPAMPTICTLSMRQLHHNLARRWLLYLWVLLPAELAGEAVWLVERPASPGLPVLFITFSPTLSACPFR